MHAAKHRVMMSGDKERYTFGAFAVPVAVKGSIIKAPKGLVDEDHPQLSSYRPRVHRIRSEELKGGNVCEGGYERLVRITVVYERIPRKLRKETFSLVGELVEVPLERKQKNPNREHYGQAIGGADHIIWLMIIDNYELGEKWE
ncbi:hypothetical protein QQP08_025790 [Theobroma cacao]|nr:hypothetical protein QQP08_025790 [Theobroma cacao]